MMANGRVDTLWYPGGQMSGGASVTQAVTPTAAGTPVAPSAPGHVEPAAQPSWESACGCPQDCLRDHERD
jgi:hypothetical protein